MKLEIQHGEPCIKLFLCPLQSAGQSGYLWYGFHLSDGAHQIIIAKPSPPPFTYLSVRLSQPGAVYQIVFLTLCQGVHLGKSHHGRWCIIVVTEQSLESDTLFIA